MVCQHRTGFHSKIEGNRRLPRPTPHHWIAQLDLAYADGVGLLPIELLAVGNAASIFPGSAPRSCVFFSAQADCLIVAGTVTLQNGVLSFGPVS